MDEQSVGPNPSVLESTPKVDLPKRQDVLNALNSSMFVFMKSVEPLREKAEKDPASLSDKDKRRLADYEIARNGWVKVSNTPDVLVQLAWESEGKQYSSKEGTPIEGVLDFLQSQIDSLTEERIGADSARQQEIDKKIREYKKNFKILEASSRSYDEARNEQGAEVNDDLRHARIAFEAKVSSEDPLRKSNNPDDKQRVDEDWRRAEEALKRRRELFVPTKESKVKEEKKSAVEEKRKEEPAGHKYPYFEDLETGESLEGIEKKLIRTKTIRDASGQVRTVEINFLQEVDRLLQQARASDPSLKNQSDGQLLEILENRVKFPGDFKDPNVKDAIYEMTKIVPDQEVLLMAIEAKRAFLLQEDNKRILAEQTKAEGEQLHRREVRAGVRHDTIIAEIDGTLDAYFGKEGVKEIPQDDLTAFGFVADVLLDVRDGSLGNGADGQAKTYRETFKELLADAKTNPESNRKLLELRRYFYRNAIDALRSRELQVSEAKTPQEQVQMEMRTLIQTLQYQISQGTSIEELRKQYKGVLSGASERSVKKIDELLRKYPAVMIDMALKGGDLLERRARYEGPKLHDVPKEIKHKRLVQGPTTLEEAAKGKGIIPPAPVSTSRRPTPTSGLPPAPISGRPESTSGMPPAPTSESPSPTSTSRPPTPTSGMPPAPTSVPPRRESPLPTEATIAIAAGKQRIEHQDAQKEKVEGMEVLEEKAREMARLQMTEDRKKWEGKLSWLKQLPARFWKFTFGDTATYGKEKSHSLKLLAESGLQVTSIRHDILQDIDALARERVKANRSNVVKRIAGKVRDVVHELTFTERDLHSERLKIVRELRMAAEDPANNQVIIQELQKANHLDLLTNFTGLLTGDLQAAEGVARRINTEFGSDLIHGLVGETMEVGLTFVGPQGQAVENFLKTKVMLPILRAGIASGVVPEQVYLQVNRQMQEYFMSSEFIAWRDSLPPAVRDKFQETLSTVSDIAGLTKEYLLPQIRQAVAHESSTVDLENYVNNLVLKVNVGTLEAAQKGIIKEGRLERLASRSITDKRVHELYEQRRNASNPSPQLVPQGYMDAAVGRAQAIRGLATLGVSNVTLGLATGVGLYATRATLGIGGRLVVPIVGGSVVGGAFRAVQEGRLFTREREQHGVERELNYQFPQDAKRRNEMQRLELHTRQMQSELADPMNVITNKIKNGTATDEEVISLMGLIADTEARMEFADVRGEKGLFRATQSQSYQVEKTNLEVAKATARASLQATLNANPARITALQNQLGINVPAGQNAVDVVLNELTKSQIENLQKGTQASAQQQLALGNLSIAQAQTVDARERAFQLTKARRMAGAFVTTVAAGVGSAALTEVVSAVVHPAILVPPAGSPVPIDNHLKLDLPKGFNVTNVDNVNHVINVTDPKGNAFVLNYVDGPNGGHVTGIVGPHGPVNLAEHRVGIDRQSLPERPLVVPPGTNPQDISGIKFNLPPGYKATLASGGRVDINDGTLVHHFKLTYDVAGKPVLTPTDPNDRLVPHFSEIPGGPTGPVSSAQIEQIWTDGGLEKLHPKVEFWTNQTQGSDYQELQMLNYVFQHANAGNYGVVLDGSHMTQTVDYLNADGTPHFVQVKDLVNQSPLKKMQFAFQLGGHKASFIVDANHGQYQLVLDPDDKSALLSNGSPVILQEDIKLPDGTVLFAKGHNMTVGDFSKMVLNQDKIKENVVDLNLNPGDTPDTAASYQTEYLNNFVPGSKAAEAFNLAVGGKSGNISTVFTDSDNSVNYLANIRGMHEVELAAPGVPQFDFGVEGVKEIPINEVELTGLEATDIYIPVLIPLARRPLEAPEGQFEPIPNLVYPSIPPVKPQPPPPTSTSRGPSPTSTSKGLRPTSTSREPSPSSVSRPLQPSRTPPFTSTGESESVIQNPFENQYIRNVPYIDPNRKIDSPTRKEPIVQTEEFFKSRLSERLRNNPQANLDYMREVPEYLASQDPEYKKLLTELSRQEGMREPMDEQCDAIVCMPVYTLAEGKIIEQTLEKYLLQIDATRNKRAVNPNQMELIIFLNHPRPKRDELEKKLGHSFTEGSEERVRQGKPEDYDTEEVIRQFQLKHPELKIRIMKREYNQRPLWGTLIKTLYDVALLRSLNRNNPGRRDPSIITNDADIVDMSTEYISTVINTMSKNQENALNNSALKIDALSGKMDLAQEVYGVVPEMLFSWRYRQMHDILEKNAGFYGANTILRASTYAAIGGVNPNQDNGADGEMAAMVYYARNYQYSQYVKYNSRAWLQTDPRRQIIEFAKGNSQVNSWNNWATMDVYGSNWKAELAKLPKKEVSKIDIRALEEEINGYGFYNTKTTKRSLAFLGLRTKENYQEAINRAESQEKAGKKDEVKRMLQILGLRPQDYRNENGHIIVDRNDFRVEWDPVNNRDRIILENIETVKLYLQQYIDERRWEVTQRKIEQAASQVTAPPEDTSPPSRPMPTIHPPQPPGRPHDTAVLSQGDSERVTIGGKPFEVSGEFKKWMDGHQAEAAKLILEDSFGRTPQQDSQDSNVIVLGNHRIARDHLRAAVRGENEDFNRWASIENQPQASLQIKVVNLPILTVDGKYVVLRMDDELYGLLKNITLTNEERKAKIESRLSVAGNIDKDGTTEHARMNIAMGGRNYSLSVGSDIGGVRDLDEDFSVARAGTIGGLPFNFAAVFDGMGGHRGGEIASQDAAKIVNNILSELGQAGASFSYDLPGMPRVTIDLVKIKDDTTEMNKLISYIRQKIKQEAKARKLTGGTTLAGVLEIGGKIFTLNCGDSRVYKKSAAGLEQVTTDHSLVQKLIDVGQLTREEAETSPQKNVIYRDLLAGNDIDMQEVQLGPGESLVIVCDGVPGAFGETYSQNPQKMIGALNTALQEDDSAKAFVKAAIASDGGTTGDNVSAIVIKPI